VIHHVFANRSNAGDWLSARGIQSQLAPWTIQEHLCDAPFVSETLAALGQASERDFIVIGGGGLFMDYFVPFWEGFHNLAARVPFAIWGTGYCDMKRETSQPPAALMEGIVRQARLCIVRDELTRRHLASCGLPAPVPCPTFLAVPTSSQPPKRRLLHVDHYDNVGADVYERMVRVGEDYSVRTGRSYRQTNNLLPSGDAAALDRILRLYASADLILTSRLHGCILALAIGRPVLAVSADHKVESFMTAAGLSDWVLDLDDLAELPQRLERLPEQHAPVEFVMRVRDQNRRVGALLRALITAGEQGTLTA
jgi:polysaccharide pyruvyl transferase WcaK-like protein